MQLLRFCGLNLSLFCN
jgi:hypothetical protein